MCIASPFFLYRKEIVNELIPPVLVLLLPALLFAICTNLYKVLRLLVLHAYCSLAKCNYCTMSHNKITQPYPLTFKSLVFAHTMWPKIILWLKFEIKIHEHQKNASINIKICRIECKWDSNYNDWLISIICRKEKKKIAYYIRLFLPLLESLFHCNQTT